MLLAGWLEEGLMAGEIASSRGARGRALAVGIVVVVAAACSGPAASTPASTASYAAYAGPPVRAADLPALRVLATAELKAWDDTLAWGAGGDPNTPVGKVDGQIGTWETPDMADNYTQALRAGLVSAAPLPTEGPLEAMYKSVGPSWQTPGIFTVPIFSAQRAYEQIRLESRVPGATCPGCRPIRFTGARLVTVDWVGTDPAGENVVTYSAPAWGLSMDNSAVVITRIAMFDKIYVWPPDRDPRPLGDVIFQTASGRADGLDLTVGFLVAARDAVHPCVMKYTAEAAESQRAIVVIVTPVPDPAVDNSDACVALGTQRTATAHLSAPLGLRHVLNSATSQEVYTTLLP
jgi:hypothetical protein